MTPLNQPAATKRASIGAIRCGDTASCDLQITTAAVEAFAQLSSDANPLHLDSSVAQEYGFLRPVAHGMLALGMISRLIGTELPGPGALWVSQELRFVSPVLVGDRLTGRVTVERVSTSVGLVALKTEVFNAETGSVVLSGTAKVRVLEPTKTGVGQNSDRANHADSPESLTGAGGSISRRGQ